MIVAISQLNFHVGNFESNTRRIIQSIREARKQGAGLVVFSELSVCGYPPGDLLNLDGFVDSCLEQVRLIAGECAGIAAIVGSPAHHPGPSGKRLFNAAFLLEDGQIKHQYNKGLLPNYDVFEEYRYFEPATDFHTLAVGNRRIALTICEDLWDIGPRPMYRDSPMTHLMQESPDLIINISASPFSWNRGGERLKTFSENARKYGRPLILVNQVGAHAELIFDGGSAVFNASGSLVELFEPFQEGLRLVDLDALEPAENQSVYDAPEPHEKNRLLLEALSFGIKEYFHKNGLKKALVGLSGGLDSALTLVLAERALGRENVWAVLLPGPFSSDHSLADALKLAENLGVPSDVISIIPTVDALEASLKPYFDQTSPGIAEENLQARARAILLMGLSNKFGYMLLNTSNKSEAAVGYGTLYGDMCGGLSVIGDIYKTEAYELAGYINRDKEVIPQHTLDKPPSAELKPGQKDSDSLPDYGELDPILFRYIEMEMGYQEIVACGHSPDLVKKVLELVNFSEFKRKQAPPVLRVSQKGFGSGRKMPLVAKFPI